MSLKISEFRDQQKAIVLRPYDVWQATLNSGSEERFVDYGWTLWKFPQVSLRPPVDWLNICSSNRSWNLSLHSWRFLTETFINYCEESETRKLKEAVAIAVDWARRKFSLTDKDSFAWYDMAVGLRANRLGYLVDVASRNDEISDEEIAVLLECIEQHFVAFEDDKRFNVNSNHGLYFVAGQLSLASRFPQLSPSSAQVRLGKQRMKEVLAKQFSTEGVHKEHSPMYHGMLHTIVKQMIGSGLIQEELLPASLDAIELAFGWFIKPNRRPAMFGDTPSYVISEKNKSLLENEYALTVLGNKRVSDREFSTSRVYPESGYAFVRTGLGGEAPELGSYLAQNCAFHSRTHKHADHLSFVWYERGYDLLIDAGSYGYTDPLPKGSLLLEDGFYYGHPARVYVESTRAHNAISIDYRNHQRAGVRPFGSGLRSLSQINGCYFIASEVTHFESILQRRILMFKPGCWLLVVDQLSDSADEHHSYTQWFQLSPELKLSGDKGSGVARFTLPNNEPLTIYSLRQADLIGPVSGQKEPEYQGWISPTNGNLEPAWSIGMRQHQLSKANFATLFSLGNFQVDSPHALISNERGEFAWSIKGETEKVTFLWEVDDIIKCNYLIR